MCRHELLAVLQLGLVLREGGETPQLQPRTQTPSHPNVPNPQIQARGGLGEAARAPTAMEVPSPRRNHGARFSVDDLYWQVLRVQNGDKSRGMGKEVGAWFPSSG